MWIVAFITVVAVLIFASRMKELKDAREAIAAAGGISSKYQCMDFSKGPKITYIVLSILGIISGIYGYTIQDYTTVALGVLIFFLFLAEFFMANIQYKFYYSSCLLYTSTVTKTVLFRLIFLSYLGILGLKRSRLFTTGSRLMIGCHHAGFCYSQWRIVSSISSMSSLLE